MKRTSGVRPACLSTALLVGFLYWFEPSFAADADCRSDSGIPSGVIAPIDVGHLRKALANAGERNLVERFFNKIKQCRRVATRYDKLAANYLAFVKLPCIRLWLRVYECTA